MPSITKYETATGTRYRVRYRKPNGRQTDKRGFKTKKLAELYAASIEVDKAHGSYIDPTAGRTTITELGKTWIVSQTHLKPSTKRTVEIAWNKHVEPKWGTHPISDVTHSAVQTWIATMSAGDETHKALGATSVIRAHGVLAGILDTAVLDRRISTNPARGIKLPRKVRKEHRYLTHEEVWRLAHEAGDKGTLILLLAYTGLRWGEAIGLRVKDLDMLRRRINVTLNAVEVGKDIEVGTPKTHKRRSVPFPQFLALRLAEACKDKKRDQLVFSDRAGQYLRRTGTSDTSQGWFANARTRAGLGHLTLHDLRHTAASLAIAAGANVKAVQTMLGHSSAEMTLDVYADLFPDDLDAVAAAFDEAVLKSNVGKMWANGQN